MRFSAYGSQGFASNVRQALFDKVLSFSFANIDAFHSASLVTRLTSDVTQLQITLMMSLRMLLRAPLMLFFSIVIVLSINARLSIIMFVAMPLLAISLLLIMRSAERLFAAMQRRLDDLNGAVQENLIAIRVVKAFVREAHEKSKFKIANDAYTEAAQRAASSPVCCFPS
jgi:ATP-binding cassette subfamily B protein